MQEKPAPEEASIKLDSTVRVRFAPSPTGSLHLGSARTALFNWLFARRHGGVVVLRIDDTDAARSEVRHEAAIIEDLRWLGLDWDEGPDVGGPFGPYRQSERLERYRAAARALLASGAAYHCFCSEERLETLRADQREAGVTPRYDRRCAALSADEVGRRLAAGEPAAVRFRVPGAEVVVDDLLRGPVTVGAGALGDFIIVRSDGTAGYNFATAVDDGDMAITHVIRGDDHLTNSARHLLLLRALGVAPPRFAHHGMILDPGGGKLSKRHGATSVGELRDLGYLPGAVLNYLALLSWSHGEDEVLDRERLVAEFDLERLSPSAAVFDRAKLDWLAHEHVMRLEPAEHERRFAERLPRGTPPRAAASLAAAFQPSLSAYGEAPALAASVLSEPELDAPAVELVAGAREQLERFAQERTAAAEWLDPAAARDLLVAYREWGAGRGLSAKRMLMPLRVALTGREHGPELHYVLGALDRAEARRRIDAALRRAADLARPASAGSSPGDQSLAAGPAAHSPSHDPPSSTKGAPR